MLGVFKLMPGGFCHTGIRHSIHSWVKAVEPNLWAIFSNLAVEEIQLLQHKLHARKENFTHYGGLGLMCILSRKK
jgi:hypothetical protein